jgi:hypothetical protein
MLHQGIRYEERGPAVSTEAKKVRARKMIRELKSLGYRVEARAAVRLRPKSAASAAMVRVPRRTLAGLIEELRRVGVQSPRRHMEQAILHRNDLPTRAVSRGGRSRGAHPAGFGFAVRQRLQHAAGTDAEQVRHEAGPP